MPNNDPFRLRVLKALTLALQDITPANQYVNDVSAAVFRGRLAYGDNDPLPMLSILEPAQSTVPALNDDGNIGGDWDVLIQGFVKDDARNPTDPAYVLMADVMRRLGQEQARRDGGRTLNILGLGGGKGGGNEIIEMKIGHGVVRPSDEISTKAYFWLTLTFKLVEDVKNPLA